MKILTWNLTQDEARICLQCLDHARRTENSQVGRNAVVLMGLLEAAWKRSEAQNGHGIGSPASEQPDSNLIGLN